MKRPADWPQALASLARAQAAESISSDASKRPASTALRRTRYTRSEFLGSGPRLPATAATPPSNRRGGWQPERDRTTPEILRKSAGGLGQQRVRLVEAAGFRQCLRIAYMPLRSGGEALADFLPERKRLDRPALGHPGLRGADERADVRRGGVERVHVAGVGAHIGRAAANLVLAGSRRRRANVLVHEHTLGQRWSFVRPEADIARQVRSGGGSASV